MAAAAELAIAGPERAGVAADKPVVPEAGVHPGTPGVAPAMGAVRALAACGSEIL